MRTTKKLKTTKRWYRRYIYHKEEKNLLFRIGGNVNSREAYRMEHDTMISLMFELELIVNDTSNAVRLCKRISKKYIYKLYLKKISRKSMIKASDFREDKNSKQGS